MLDYANISLLDTAAQSVFFMNKLKSVYYMHVGQKLKKKKTYKKSLHHHRIQRMSDLLFDPLFGSMGT